ncbi:MAG: IS21 family transposase [Nanoarchaeota archaeon]|nr:IS21 family transposase [Nanoarchaeota archaeon]
MKKIDIFEYLNEKGFDIGYTTICNYISEKRNKVKEAYIRQVYKPGEVCEFDWGEVKLVIAGKRRTLNMAVFTPAMSNYRYAMLFHRQDSISFQQAHVNFFEHVGGVYQTMVFDNMRVAIRRFVGPQEKEPTDALLKLSMYYKFGFRFCNVRKGNEKGHVERSVEYVRRKAFSIKDTFACLEEANGWLQSTNNRINTCHNRFAKGKKPMDLFNQEKPFLYPVPPRFDCATLEQSRADKYSTICYATNHYSVPDNLVGKIIDIKIYPEKLICYHGQDKICEHERQYVHHGWHITLEHYLNTLYRKPGALAGSRALETAPENVKLTYENYFKHDSRGFVELLLFAKSNKYDFEDLEKVINRLKKICPNDISVDKIKALCMQKETKLQNLHDKNDPILMHSNQQLQSYCDLLN